MKPKFTIMLPVHRSNLTLANNCIRHLLDNSEYNIIVIDDFGRDEDYIQDPRVSFIHNTFEKRQPLVKIWNQCIKECPTDNVIIASWRQRPTPKHFEIIETKLADRFAMVSFDGLHFFGFNKYLTTIVGWFDEGFTDGQFEDCDWWRRLRQKNVAIYVGDVAEERVINNQYVPSMWPSDSANKAYYETKWKEDHDNKTIILFHEELNKEDRLIYTHLPTISYRDWSESVLEGGLAHFFNTYKTVEERYEN